jgi:hypothetical protein
VGFNARFLDTSTFTSSYWQVIPDVIRVAMILNTQSCHKPAITSKLCICAGLNLFVHYSNDNNLYCIFLFSAAVFSATEKQQYVKK